MSDLNNPWSGYCGESAASVDRRVKEAEANLRIEMLERRVAGLESDLAKLIKIMADHFKAASQ